MNKNLLYRIYAAAFVGICLVPAALTPFKKTDSTKEKRQLAEAPKIKKDGKLNFDYFDEFEKYFSEHFAFRQELVNADGRLKSTVFGTSPNKDVIVGKDGWLYYGATVNDFLNINMLSQRGINNILSNIELMNDYCSQHGADFLFMIAPNKNSVYPEYMPFNYVSSDNKDNYERLAESLKDKDYWCDMKETILNTDSSMPLYHKTDTHWNNMGAYAGHVKLMEMLGHKFCPAGTRWFTRDDRLGDLAAMIYPAEDAKDTQVYNDYEFTYNYRGRFKGLDDITINTICETGEDTLLMWRDSYGEAILPYMAESYASAEFSRSVPYRMDNINGGDVILEIVERNIGNLQKYAPVMEAPETETPAATALYSGDSYSFRSEQFGELTHLFGELPDKCFESDKVSIVVTVGDKSYKAFNCFEDQKLDRSGESSDNGFSIYIPSAAYTEGSNVTVSVINDNGRTIQINL